jgi:hypothetical protein
VFRKPSRAAEAVAGALGTPDARLIDWGSLALVSNELADQKRRRFLPDLRFTARLLKHPIEIDVLFEHQSKVDRLIPVRLFCETGASWSSSLAEKRGRVPFVLSVVLYNGRSRWARPRELWHTIDGGAHLHARAPHLLPALPFALMDLAALTDVEIDRRVRSPAVRVVLRLLKHAPRGRGIQTLREAHALVRSMPLDVLGRAVRYVEEVDRSADPRVMADTLGEIRGKPGRELVVTWADRLRKEAELKGKAVGKAEGKAEGRAEGKAEGRAEGKAEGRAEGKADALLRILRRRRLHLSERQLRRIATCRDIGRLNRWMDAAVDAESATEVLRSATRH